MADGLVIAAYSMEHDHARMATIAHNLANVGTVGFKRGIPVASAFLTHLGRAGHGTGPMNIPVANAPSSDMQQGMVRFTGNPLDLALEGDGFFELRGPGGPVYTRQGTFQIDPRGRLVGESGMAVMGISGEILLSGNQPLIDNSGRITEEGRQIAQLRIVKFTGPTSLQPIGNGMYAPSEPATPPIDSKATLRQGHVEMSNVTSTREMVRLIETVRHFEATQKVVQAYDGMLDRAVAKLGEF